MEALSGRADEAFELLAALVAPDLFPVQKRGIAEVLASGTDENLGGAGGDVPMV